MNETDHRVTLVHPLARVKYISWLNPETGELVKRNKSPFSETPRNGIAELRPFLPFLEDPRFSVLFPLVELEEFRLLDGWGRGGKRGSHRYELIPLSLYDTCMVTCGADIMAYFPDGLPEEFVSKDFQKATRLAGYALYDTLAIYETLGAIERCGKRGNAYLYRKK